MAAFTTPGEVFYRYSGSYGQSPTKTSYTLPSTSGNVLLSLENDTSLLGKLDIGGPFAMFKRTNTYDVVEVPAWMLGYTGWAGGRFTGSISGLSLSLPSDSSANSTVNQMHARSYDLAPRAIATLNPVKPNVDMATALGEVVKDGLPSILGLSLWRDRANLARGAGSEYLNYQFGWAPLVSDIKKFSKTVIDADDIIRNYESNKGRRQRRSMDLESSDQVVTTGTSSNQTVYPADTYSFGLGTTTKTQHTGHRIWFSGAFKYYIPDSGMGRYAAMARKLYGIRLTPDVLWNLAPWSWAADWFGNVGDVLTNISALGSDASVMEWGYVMHHTSVKNQHSLRIKGSNRAANPVSNQDFTLITTSTLEFKTRVKGSPFHFSANLPELSARQIAILAALGLSRS